MQEELVIFLLFSFVIAGGVLILITGMRHRFKALEMAHRERLAMIERGHPLPSGRPAVFHDRPASTRSNRLLSGGIVIVGLGLAVAMLLGFASREPEIAVGVGGAIAILGGAFIVTAYLVHGQGRADTAARPRDVEPSPPPPPPPPIQEL